jgi:hypothetical protein
MVPDLHNHIVLPVASGAVLKCNGEGDHVRLVVSYPPTVGPPNLIKGAEESCLVKHHADPLVIM